MRSFAVAAVGCLCIAVWLILLEVTDFSAVSVSAGLFGGLVLTGTAR